MATGPETARLAKEHAQLVEEVAKLQTLEAAACRETERWRGRSLELEHECAALALTADASRAELQQARWLERGSLARSLGDVVVREEARERESCAESQAWKHWIEVETLERECAELRASSDAARLDLREARAENEAAGLALERLRHEHQLLRADHEAQQHALTEAVSRSAMINSRNESLEARLDFEARHPAPSCPERTATRHSATTRVLASPRGAAAWAGALQKQHAQWPGQTPLFEDRVVGAGTVRAGSLGASRRAAWEVASLVADLQSPLGGPLSPLRARVQKSRHEYPRGPRVASG